MVQTIPHNSHPWGNRTFILYMVPWAHPSPHAKRHFDRFSAQRTVEYPITLQRAATFPQKITPSLCGIGSPSNTRYPPESLSLTASRSVHPFSYGSQMRGRRVSSEYTWHNDKQQLCRPRTSSIACDDGRDDELGEINYMVPLHTCGGPACTTERLPPPCYIEIRGMSLMHGRSIILRKRK